MRAHLYLSMVLCKEMCSYLAQFIISSAPGWHHSKITFKQYFLYFYILSHRTAITCVYSFVWYATTWLSRDILRSHLHFEIVHRNSYLLIIKKGKILRSFLFLKVNDIYLVSWNIQRILFTIMYDLVKPSTLSHLQRTWNRSFPHNISLIAQPKPMLWVLKRTVSLRQFQSRHYGHGGLPLGKAHFLA